ncbi:hypothetical protein VNO78_11691 [Psophocarpus tetragonolobus]|uniref:F-box domain-containing protein n=1 Tax=Psophocarpus tetragonolobus TaxID=3891 RepID=A0AAN9SUP4_PSOTE
MALGLEGYTYTTALGRKRVVLLHNVGGASSPNSNSGMTSLKRMCSEKINLNSERSRLETLPLDILIRVLCGVDHEDLRQLVRVSKTIREATEIARWMHFEYSTPKKKTFVLGGAFDIEGANGFEESEAPNAPLRKRQSKLIGKNLASISVALFASTTAEQ